MKNILLIIGLFLLFPLLANADVIDINGETYATEDSVVVHCIDGEFRDLTNLPRKDVSHIFSRKEVSIITLNGKQYINLDILSQSLLAEGKGLYVIPKSQKANVGTKIGKIAVREYVYNGSEYAMKHTPTGRYYIQNTIAKTENLVSVLQSPSFSSWDKIRNVIYAFGY